MNNSKVLCVCVLAASLLLIACDEGPPTTVVDPELEALEADYILYGFTNYLTRRGVREAVVEADEALVFQDSTVVLLSGNVKLTAYHEELGTEKAIVTADRGRLDQGTNHLYARGNAVLLIQADGRRIESSELQYSPDNDNIRSDSSVVMYEGEDVIEGTAFTSDLNFEQVRIFNARTRGGAVRF